jgi:hypothetical protein
MTDQALTVPDKRVPHVHGKLRQACLAMVWDGLPWDQAARKANLSLVSMRKALERAHVLAFLRQQKHVLRESVSCGNIHAFVDVRDNSGNPMARVQAGKALEQLSDVEQARGGAQQAMPGLVIRIVTETPIKTTLNANGDLIDE